MTVNQKMTALADAIRELSGTTEPLTIDDMVSRIREVSAIFIFNIAEGTFVSLTDSAERILRGLKLFGKTVQNGTPMPSAPVALESMGEGGNIAVSVCGKNLFAGAEPGSVSASGEEITSANDTARRTPFIGCKPGDKFAFSKAIEFTGTSDNGMIRCFDKNKVLVRSITALPYNSLSNVLTIPAGVAYFRFVQFGYARYENVNIQIEKNEVVTEYEAPVAFKQLIVPTSDGLPGIPVSANGNYTDENGQQWICDEIDFAKGKYIQRVGKIASYAGQNITRAYLSTTGQLSTGATVLYQMEMPVEINLPAEILAAYSSLCTHNPNTTIYSDSGVWMVVKYAADTKTYVDGKFSEMAVALMNNV